MAVIEKKLSEAIYAHSRQSFDVSGDDRAKSAFLRRVFYHYE